MKLIFSHGKESGPWGFKIRRLAPIAERHGYRVDSIDYRDCMDPELRVARLLERLRDEDPGFVLAGSSMGGYVSLAASETAPARALFLIAPALYMPGYERRRYRSQAAHIEVVHGWSDAVIPVQHSIDYARGADCTLHLVSGDHPLNGSIDEIETLFDRFLGKLAAAAHH